MVMGSLEISQFSPAIRIALSVVNSACSCKVAIIFPKNKFSLIPYLTQKSLFIDKEIAGLHMTVSPGIIGTAPRQRCCIRPYPLKEPLLFDKTHHWFFKIKVYKRYVFKPALSLNWRWLNLNPLLFPFFYCISIRTPSHPKILIRSYILVSE